MLVLMVVVVEVVNVDAHWFQRMTITLSWSILSHLFAWAKSFRLLLYAWLLDCVLYIT